MSEAAGEPREEEAVEAVLRRQLARGDAVLESVPTVLHHILANDDHAFFGDEVVAGVRGMLADLARQLCEALDTAETPGSLVAPDDARIPAVMAKLADVCGLAGHMHAFALEWQLTQRLQAQLGLDPVISPPVQALIASPDSDIATIAMKLLASQARFARTQRRMQLPLSELPGELLHGVLGVLAEIDTGGCGGVMIRAAANSHVAAAESAIRGQYEESASRLGLASRLVAGMGAGAVAALSLTHAGVALFATACALGCTQDRELCILSMQEGQDARLALALLAGGASGPVVEESLLALHPEGHVPHGLGRMGGERAASLLADGLVPRGR